MEPNNQTIPDLFNNYSEFLNSEYNQTEFDFLFNNFPRHLIEEPIFKINMNFGIEETKQDESNQIQTDSSIKQIKKKDILNDSFIVMIMKSIIQTEKTE